MRCCRSDWPGLCLFCCYQPLCVVSQQRWFGLFFCFINFPIISTFTPIFFIEISFVLLPPPPLEWWDAVLQKRLAWALFVLLLLTLVCCQPTKLIWCFINFPILPPPPPPFHPALPHHLRSSLGYGFLTSTLFAPYLFVSLTNYICTHTQKKKKERGRGEHGWVLSVTCTPLFFCFLFFCFWFLFQFVPTSPPPPPPIMQVEGEETNCITPWNQTKRFKPRNYLNLSARFSSSADCFFLSSFFLTLRVTVMVLVFFFFSGFS